MTIEARWAIRFEGIGIDPAQAGATAWGYGESPATPGPRDWLDAMAVQPASIDSSVDPATGEFSLSAFVFELHNLDTVALTFLYQQTQPTGFIRIALSRTGTTVSIDRTDLSGEVIFVGMETIRLGTHTGSGNYSGCNRAYHGSTGSTHDLGRGYYLRAPKWRGRAVELVSHSDSGSAVIRWRGLVDGISTSEDGTILRISCRELWSTLIGTKVNRGADAVQEHGIRLRTLTPGAIDGQLRAGSSAIKQTLIQAESSPRYGFFQVADGLFVFNYASPSNGVWRPASVAQGGSGKTVLDSDYDPRSPDRVLNPLTTFPIYEVFCVFKDLDRRLVALGDPPASATRGYDYPYHPLTIAAVLLFGSDSAVGDRARYDSATPRWAANLGNLFADNIITVLNGLIAETRGIEVDFFLLGWDGKEEDIIRVIVTRLLRPYGFFLGVTTDGLLTIARFRLFDVTAYDAAIGNEVEALTSPLQIEYDTAQGSAVDVIEARVGELPWRAGRNITLQASGGDADRSRLGDNQRWTVDYSTIDASNIDEAIRRVIALSQLGVWALPRIMIRVDDANITGRNLDHGALCTLADLPINEAYLVDNQGNRLTALNNAVEFTGMIIGRRYLVGPRAYEITLLLTNFRGGLGRLRCPSMRVFSKSGSTVTAPTVSEYGGLTHDAAEFNVGDQVQFYVASTFALFDPAVYTITGINNATRVVTLNADPGAVTGTIMELAPYPLYTNRPRVTNTSLLVYTFLAISGELATGEAAHVYGLSPD
jgi:hypothetical protein